MGKKGRRRSQGSQKKSKNRKEAEETDDNNAVQVEESRKCVHVLKAAKLDVLQNNIPHMKLRECSFCENGQNEDTGICICLQCGKQGCDRSSEDKHALSHYESNLAHCLTVNLYSMMVWCYSCDMEVPVQPNTDLHECIKLLLKALNMKAPNDEMPSIPNMTNGEPMKKSEAMKLKYVSNSNKIKGLVNLGNTCFFNSVMQNLFQTELLHVAMAFVNQPEYSQTITTRNDLPSVSVEVITPPGSLITALTKLLYEYRSSSPGTLNPKFLFSEICKKAPRFKGFQQQDSQELLRYLLDSVKTEQLRRVKIGVLKALEIIEGTEVKSLPEVKKEQLKEYVSYVTAPSVDSVFLGRLDSIVVCHECHKESRVTENFLDLSLSLAVPQLSKGRLKTPSVSQQNKKNTSHQGEQENKGEDKSSTKPLTPSKHQKKAAREAKRKKGRKGKKRTMSHSASDDGRQETKQPEENMEATSDESDHDEYHDAEATDDVITDHSKDKGDFNMESCAIDSGLQEAAKQSGGEEEAANDKRVEDNTKVIKIEKTEDPGKTEVTEDSEIRNPTTMDFGVEIGVTNDTVTVVENTKDPGIPSEKVKDCRSGLESGVAKDSGIKETIAKDSGPNEVTAKDSEEERPQRNKGDLEMLHSERVSDSEVELKGENEEKIENNMETDVEKGSNDTKDAINDTKFPSLEDDFSEPLPNTDFQMKKDKELENGEKCDLSGKISNEEENLKSEEELNKNHCCRSNNTCISHGDSAGDRSKTISADGAVNCNERKTIKNDESLANAKLEKSEHQLNVEEVGLCCVVNDVDTAPKIDKNLGSSDNKTQSNSNNEDGTLQDDVALCNSCERCGKVEQSCELEKNDCGCLVKDGAMKKAGETESAFDDKEKITDSVVTGLKELEITENNISGKNTEERFDKNAESNEQHPKKSPELKQNAEEKVSSNEENFLPKVHTLGSAYSSLPGECSVQSCLSLFCSPEILQGRNKFACEECSRRKKKGGNEQGKKDEASSNDDDEDDDDESHKGATASKPKTKKESQSSVVYTEATKLFLLSSTPPVLTLHFKRFQQVGFGLRKVPKHVDFPLVLDLAPFCRRNEEISCDSKQQVLYSLIGVVEHSGGLNSGHYTAFVKLKSSPTYGHFTDLTNVKDFSCFIEGIWKKDRKLTYAHAQPRNGQWYHVSDSRVSMVTEARVLKSQAYMLFYERLPFRIISNLDN
ncbi:ubiquitin carboxyl-terminal hydrolase 16-like [Actinia tenebrosa]|uniref:Ubiquitin carboxyl-terminal hydrolase 16-like n=1 Tax=Actinia tenebrosa TaxID=6105 RepID=A0A6P8HBD6_ACTTE|nr:ubiquitin carboxyl-terminal hydrolase 16-like [Actinia tenebrosa]